MKNELAAIRVIVQGRVQGVSFRDFASRQANELGLTGYVRNLPDWYSVEVQAEGETEKLKKLASRLKSGPRGAKVEKIDVSWVEYTGSYADFNIRY